MIELFMNNEVMHFFIFGPLVTIKCCKDRHLDIVLNKYKLSNVFGLQGYLGLRG